MTKKWFSPPLHIMGNIFITGVDTMPGQEELRVKRGVENTDRSVRMPSDKVEVETVRRRVVMVGGREVG